MAVVVPKGTQGKLESVDQHITCISALPVAEFKTGPKTRARFISSSSSSTSTTTPSRDTSVLISNAIAIVIYARRSLNHTHIYSSHRPSLANTATTLTRLFTSYLVTSS